MLHALVAVFASMSVPACTIALSYDEELRRAHPVQLLSAHNLGNFPDIQLNLPGLAQKSVLQHCPRNSDHG